jgi:hypothetical protein
VFLHLVMMWLALHQAKSVLGNLSLDFFSFGFREISAVDLGIFLEATAKDLCEAGKAQEMQAKS